MHWPTIWPIRPPRVVYISRQRIGSSPTGGRGRNRQAGRTSRPRERRRRLPHWLETPGAGGRSRQDQNQSRPPVADRSSSRRCSTAPRVDTSAHEQRKQADRIARQNPRVERRAQNAAAADRCASRRGVIPTKNGTISQAMIQRTRAFTGRGVRPARPTRDPDRKHDQERRRDDPGIGETGSAADFTPPSTFKRIMTGSPSRRFVKNPARQPPACPGRSRRFRAASPAGNRASCDPSRRQSKVAPTVASPMSDCRMSDHHEEKRLSGDLRHQCRGSKRSIPEKYHEAKVPSAMTSKIPANQARSRLQPALRDGGRQLAATDGS